MPKPTPSRILKKYLYKTAGFIVAELEEDPANGALMHKTKLLVSELKDAILSRIGADPIEDRALNALSKAMISYQKIKEPTVGVEKDYQFLLLLGIRELERPKLDHAETTLLAKKIESLLTASV